MADHLGVDEQTFFQRYTKQILGRRSLAEVKIKSGQYDCVFLQRDDAGKAMCGIYPVRPTQCRTWPFWDSNLKSPRDWRQAAQTCPGMQQGGNFVPIEEIRIRLAKNPDGL